MKYPPFWTIGLRERYEKSQGGSRAVSGFINQLLKLKIMAKSSKKKGKMVGHCGKLRTGCSWLSYMCEVVVYV